MTPEGGLAAFEADTPLVAGVRPSPNHNERRLPDPPDVLILHYTGMPTAAEAVDWLCDLASEVSSHYVVEEDGTILQLVAETRRAWHAGAGSWRGQTDINSRSIGIEIVNAGHAGGLPPFADAQIEAVIALCQDILRRRPEILAERVLAHSDTAPDRKIDPGERFPWDRLHAAGIGHLVPPAPLSGGRFFGLGDQGEPVEALQSMLAAYGYGVGISGRFDAATESATRAFQRHFRPAKVDGVADMSTVTTLHRLLSSLPRSPFADA
ncbi:N-acetylmuramoyl-L-alanine amidase [Aurantimonas sp. MSK8Z-1]|uniref:N-acetylmuramoyl-L-alanine amidase n=1 Tax=Mangrovibrevibacter kandeliae TaxID=2968473 RepID=UPI002119B04C|nr:N-acetylmuramoyl-L-alanine amidase [Aurantimonas sp. MSK8Z-1]MCW4116671.1 N-acetylmuramoyl-L-alanine amidase [Aurantimonas sp. MSK8Z-1]